MSQTTNKTKLLGIIGTPLEHTLSPRMHSFIAEEYNIDAAYLAFDVQSENFSQVVGAAKSMGAMGFNITAPYKIDVMDCIDVVDPEAAVMNSVNTIVNKSGKWYGYNTDGDGFVNALELDGIDLSGKKVLILGAGGSARSICYKFAKKKIHSLTISARNEKSAAIIGEVIAKHTDTAFIYGLNPCEKYDIIVNTTPMGMHPHQDVCSFTHLDMIEETTVVCDIIYNPKKTVLLKESEKRGARIVNGLNMLILQGIYAFELFTGSKIDRQMYHKLLDLFDQFRI